MLVLSASSPLALLIFHEDSVVRLTYLAAAVLSFACSSPTDSKATASFEPPNEFTRVEGSVTNGGVPMNSATVLVQIASNGTNSYLLSPVLTGEDGRFSQVIGRVDKMPNRKDTVTASITVYPKWSPLNGDGTPQATVVDILLRFAGSVSAAPTTHVGIQVAPLR